MSDATRKPAEYQKDGLRLRLIGAPADLAPYIAGIYRTEVEEGVVVEDWLPPEEGNLRTGRGAVYEAAPGDGEITSVPPVVISGPSNRVTRLRIGGGKYWGIGLTPAGWSRIVRSPAHQFANRFVDIDDTNVSAELSLMLRTLDDEVEAPEDAAELVGGTLRGLLGKRPPSESTIHAVHLSLVSEDAIAVGPIANMAGMVPRTFERFCKRHFGFGPQVLLKRQRFLRSLAKYMLDPSMKWINSLDTHYWDQAHFIRDFRATMNMTPSEYAALPHPVVKAAVSVISASTRVAMHGLYHPQRDLETETGL